MNSTTSQYQFQLGAAGGVAPYNWRVAAGALPRGLTVETVGREDERLGQGGAPFDRIAAQAYSSFPAATVVTVGPEVVLDEPVAVTITGPGVGETAYGHTQIRLERFAKATIVIDQAGSGTYAENIEFIVGEGAHLTVVNLHEWADDTVHVAAHHALLQRDAVLRHFAISLGGDLVRLSPRVRYAAPGGDAELWGLYFADAGQHLEQRRSARSRTAPRPRVSSTSPATRSRGCSTTCRATPRASSPSHSRPARRLLIRRRSRR